MKISSGTIRVFRILCLRFYQKCNQRDLEFLQIELLSLKFENF